MDQAITIGSRYNGPPSSGNGGYVCGLLGQRIDGPAQVTLRVPPPLERPLTLTEDAGTLLLCDGDTVVAEGQAATVEARPPTTVGLDVAADAAQGYPGFTEHLFPTCFVCGPDRSPTDGLRVFPGPVAGAAVSAAPWTPAEDLADTGGRVLAEVVWAALDCPSYFGGVSGVPAVLGQLAVEVMGDVLTGEPHVALGWSRGSEGRKHFAAAAVTAADGALLAVSEATWIELRQPPDAGRW